MNLSMRRRRDNNGTAIRPQSNEYSEIDVPSHYRCPISLDLMKDPVTLSTGMTYDRASIEKWIDTGNLTCPATNQALASFDQIPNHTIRRMIQDWCVQNRSRGVERIPTPRIPPATAEVAKVCDRIAAAAERKNAKRCGELVAKVKAWAGDGDRSRKVVAESRAVFVLSASFEAFSGEEGGDLAEEILSVLPGILGGDKYGEGRARLASDASLRRLVSFLRGNDLSSRQNAVLVLKELLSSSEAIAEPFARIKGSTEGLVGIIKEPICSRATKASLTAIFHMMKKNNKSTVTTASSFVELGLVPLLLEAILESSERGVCERAAMVLDRISDAGEARAAARDNALTTPLAVKKILRVSDFATECLVSFLWKILAMESDGDAVVAALEAGAFEKMLLMLQIGCSERCKEKVNELLKLLNLHRRRLDCVDVSVNMKYIKRSF